MPSAEEELSIQSRASLDALLRIIDEQIAAIELPDIPKPAGRIDDPNPALALQAEVEQLCAQRAVNMREQQLWMVEAERAIRENNDERAKEALTRHAEHLRLALEADALLTEFRSLITDVRRSLSVANEPGDSAAAKDAGY